MATTQRQNLWPHQKLCLDQAISKDTIVCLPTNKGKTLIAARLIEYFLQRSPDQRAVFIVPTQALVDQQAKRCEEQIHFEGMDSYIRVLRMVGDEQAGWGSRQWKEAFENHDIFLGTPAVFQKALVTSRYLSPAAFSVFVFDECHNAKGNHAMACVMRDGIHPHINKINKSETGLPRILGLTASFANGKTNNLTKDRQDLERILHATILCPKVEQKLAISNYTRIPYNGNDKHHTKHHEAIIERHLEVSLNRIFQSENTTGIKLSQFKDVKKVLRQCAKVFSQLGRGPLEFYVQQTIVQQIQDKIEKYESMEDEKTKDLAQRLKNAMPMLRNEVKELSQRLSDVVLAESMVPRVTRKLQRLLDLLVENFQKKGEDGYRGIIFVEEVSLVAPMANQINDCFCDAGASTRCCGVVAGSSVQRRADRITNLDGFRSGDLRILVSTSACEEGLDVPQCQFSVMFSEVKTAKSHIQRTGRVRHSSAELYYFENDPASEVRRAEKVLEVARDTSLALSSEELKKENSTICAASSNMKHPYPCDSDSDEGLVTVRNSKEIFLQYCCGILSESVAPTKSLYYSVQVDGHQQEVLTSVQYPTPEGWQTIEKKEVHDYWEGEDLTKVFSPSPGKRLTKFEKDERLFAFVIVRKLRETGLLDQHNEPNMVAKSLSKLACPLGDRSPLEGFSLKQNLRLPHSTEKEIEGNEQGEMATDRGTFVITLESSAKILRRYVKAVFEDGDRVFEEDLFEHGLQHDESGQRTRSIPQCLRYPTPRGWSEVTLADYFKAFENRDLDDQLSQERCWTKAQKVELALMSLAVSNLHDWGYLNEECQACLSDAALRSTRLSCPLEMSTQSPTSVREVSISGSAFGNTGISSISRPSNLSNLYGVEASSVPGTIQAHSPHAGASVVDMANSGRMSLASSGIDSTIDNLNTSNESAASFSHEACRPQDAMSTSNSSGNQEVWNEEEEDNDDEQMRSVNSGQRSFDHDTMSECELMSTNATTSTRSQNARPMISNRFSGQFDDCDDDYSTANSGGGSGIQEFQNFSHTPSENDLTSNCGISSSRQVPADASPSRIEGPIFNSFGSGQFDDCDDEFSL